MTSIALLGIVVNLVAGNKAEVDVALVGVVAGPLPGAGAGAGAGVGVIAFKRKIEIFCSIQRNC